MTSSKMQEPLISKPVYDLEERTFLFAKNVRQYIKGLPKTMEAIEDGKQVIRSSGSVGANYIEANESLSRKDFVFRIKICRKESKESTYFLRLILACNSSVFSEKGKELQDEALQLKKIFSSIIEKSK